MRACECGHVNRGESEMQPNSKYRMRIAVVFVAFIELAACVPVTAYDTLEVKTQIVDARTGAPIPNASVTTWANDNPTRKAAGVSDTHGEVNVPSETHVVWLPALPIDLVVPPGTIHVEALGCQARDLGTQDAIRNYFLPMKPIELSPAN